MLAALEGLLFVVGDEGLTIDQIKDILEITTDEANKYIEELQKEYEKDNRGIRLSYLGNTYKLTTKSEHKEYYERLLELGDSKTLSQSALETLAIIAYNEPITRSEVDDLRGVSSVQIIRKLVAKEFVKELGRKEVPGRPILYGITNEFLDYFGLSSKDQLPKFEDVIMQSDEIDLYDSKYMEEIL
ncbi:MAG TPA: SMC-Scp complex subunit ScpB [Bacilli bacterium]|nr:SMC-Scp complex subunit ScpB [Bacilli bacterium]